MSTPYLAEIRMISFNFPPKGWAFCNGQLLSIAQNQALFALLGTTYGGNGVTTFGLPDLRGRSPFGAGAGQDNTMSLGQRGGEESHTLSATEMPTHTHDLYGRTTLANTGAPAGALLGAKGRFGRDMLGPGADTALAGNAVSSVGGSQPHTNMQPYLVMNFVISLSGIFPSQI